MKRAKTVRPKAQQKLQPGSTGRDGAIDFSLKMDSTEANELGTDHIYRVIELVGTSGREH